MRPYFLVSLWAGDDEATCLSHDFACRFHQRRQALAFIEGEAPRREDVQSAVAADPSAPVIFFAHGGARLSARRGGSAWIHAEELAQLLPGRRIYAFACSTFEPQTALYWSTFAIQAVTACVAVFVGHQAPVMTPLAGEGGISTQMETPLFHMIDSFINGEDDADALRSCGRRLVSWDLPIELDLPSEDPSQEGAFGWSSAAYLGGFFNSLRVRTKADDAA